MNIRKNILRSVLMLVAMTLLCGGLYTLAVTGVAQLVFPQQSNGSIIQKDGKDVGSALIGQNFTDPAYFWGRPSATANYPYNVLSSAGSNKSVTSEDEVQKIADRIAYLRAADPGNNAPVPVDLVTASASGLDPDISVAAAQYQAGRVAKARGLSASAVDKLISDNTEGRFLGIFGEERIDVLKLNIALDSLSKQ